MRAKISLHPKFAAGIAAFLALVALVWLRFVGVWWMLLAWYIFVNGVWAALTKLVYHPPQVSRVRHFLSLVVFCIGVSLLLLFVEWPPAWYAVGFVFVFYSAGSFWLLPPVESKLAFMMKPHRRWLLFLNGFGLAGIWSGVYAIAAFQIFYTVTIWAWVAAGSVITALVSAWWWREYGIEYGKRMVLWAVIWFVIMMELGFAIMLLPIGYLAGGLLIAWFWYDLWLITRFHLSKEGINWKKQRWFLILNAVLIAVFLVFAVRWK